MGAYAPARVTWRIFFYKVWFLAAEEELIPIERCQNCTINTTRAFFVILLMHFTGFGNVRIGSACPDTELWTCSGPLFQSSGQSPFKGDDDDEVSLAGDQGGVERVQQLREEHRIQLARVRERPLKY